MKVRVVYIGSDELFWKRVQTAFRKDYSHFEFTFENLRLDHNFSPIDAFIELAINGPQIIYLDYTTHSKECIQLAKLLNRNNETRLVSVVGIYGSQNKNTILNKSLAAEVRINHEKSDEVQDIIYDPISLLDVDQAVMPGFVRSEAIEKFEIWQPLRLGYIENNRFHVETNSYLEEGTIVDIDTHPLIEIMPSRKVFVEKFYDENLYYNKRFAYDLEFIYIDNDYFVATNQNWIKYKTLKEDPELLEEINDVEKEDIIKDMEERKKIFDPTKKQIDLWMKERVNQKIPKKLKIMVIDDQLSLLKQVGKLDGFPYSINFQRYLLGDLYQVKRSEPHLIIFNSAGRNNEAILQKLVKKIQSLKNYNPYLLVFNNQFDGEKFKSESGYSQVLFYDGDVSLDTVKSMASKLDQKLEISNSGEQVFLSHSEPNSLIFMKREVRVVSLTESVLYFESPTEVPMWTVFKVMKPVQMLLTVVPHKKEGKFSSIQNCYRCLINGVGEVEKSHLRQLINKTLEVHHDEEN